MKGREKCDIRGGMRTEEMFHKLLGWDKIGKSMSVVLI